MKKHIDALKRIAKNLYRREKPVPHTQLYLTGSLEQAYGLGESKETKLEDSLAFYYQEYREANPLTDSRTVELYLELIRYVLDNYPVTDQPPGQARQSLLLEEHTNAYRTVVLKNFTKLIQDKNKDAALQVADLYDTWLNFGVRTQIAVKLDEGDPSPQKTVETLIEQVKTDAVKENVQTTAPQGKPQEEKVAIITGDQAIGKMINLMRDKMVSTALSDGNSGSYLEYSEVTQEIDAILEMSGFAFDSTQARQTLASVLVEDVYDVLAKIQNPSLILKSPAGAGRGPRILRLRAVIESGRIIQEELIVSKTHRGNYSHKDYLQGIAARRLGNVALHQDYAEVLVLRSPENDYNLAKTIAHLSFVARKARARLVAKKKLKSLVEPIDLLRAAAETIRSAAAGRMTFAWTHDEAVKIADHINAETGELYISLLKGRTKDKREEFKIFTQIWPMAKGYGGPGYQMVYRDAPAPAPQAE